MSDQPAPATPPGFPTPPVVPPPYTGPYASPGAVYPASAPGPAPQRPATLGIVALVLALLATVGASIVAAVAGLRIAEVLAAAMLASPSGAFDWSALAPARGAVMVGELSFWIGTALGVWALVQGIIAMVQQRGRGVSIAAVVIAAAGPVVFCVAVVAALSVGGAGPFA
ncbi:hypothetical protein [Microbacterium sp. zg-YB36]|uniref:hypothetical protein n=1 Tax=Microbacterium sp. zg-YB36 TaxID=2969407 RepID=UPI00214C0F85|nr:hypothetical protein [Microbacterium sp. zg-YB36]MDL5350771.1 hypothetical protein [Microbacterium sp. zg-YB36]